MKNSALTILTIIFIAGCARKPIGNSIIKPTFVPKVDSMTHVQITESENKVLAQTIQTTYLDSDIVLMYSSSEDFKINRKYRFKSVDNNLKCTVYSYLIPDPEAEQTIADDTKQILTEGTRLNIMAIQVSETWSVLKLVTGYRVRIKIIFNNNDLVIYCDKAEGDKTTWGELLVALNNNFIVFSENTFTINEFVSDGLRCIDQLDIEIEKAYYLSKIANQKKALTVNHKTDYTTDVFSVDRFKFIQALKTVNKQCQRFAPFIQIKNFKQCNAINNESPEALIKKQQTLLRNPINHCVKKTKRLFSEINAIVDP